MPLAAVLANQRAAAWPPRARSSRWATSHACRPASPRYNEDYRCDARFAPRQPVRRRAGDTDSGSKRRTAVPGQYLAGPTGTGKTWLSCALGHRACRDNRSVLYQRVPRLLEALGLARGDGRYARMLKSLARVQLLILDDWGITPLTAEQRRDLLEIVDDRHGRASTVVTSQLPVVHWHEHIGNPTIANAVLDRLVHRAHRIELKGESLRKLRAVKPVRLDETAGC